MKHAGFFYFFLFLLILKHSFLKIPHATSSSLKCFRSSLSVKTLSLSIVFDKKTNKQRNASPISGKLSGEATECLEEERASQQGREQSKQERIKYRGSVPGQRTGSAALATSCQGAVWSESRGRRRKEGLGTGMKRRRRRKSCGDAENVNVTSEVTTMGGAKEPRAATEGRHAAAEGHQAVAVALSRR